MRGDMHGSIRKTYVKHKTYRKLNICKTSVFPDVAKSWCSKLYGLCAQTEIPPTAPWRLALTRVPKAFGRRRALRRDGGFDVAGDVGDVERRNGRDVRKHGKEREPHGQEPAAQDGTDPRQAVYGQINVYGVTTKSERHKRSYWTRTADGNGIGGRKAPVPYGS